MPKYCIFDAIEGYFSAFVGKSWPKVHDFSEKQGDFLSKAADFFRKVAERAEPGEQAKSRCGAKATTSASSSGVSPRCASLPPAFAMLAVRNLLAAHTDLDR